MDLHIENSLFIVGGAGSGFGKAVALALADEGAQVLAVSRTYGKLKELQDRFSNNIEIYTGDLTNENTLSELISMVKGRTVSGVFFNAGGPPAGTFDDISLQQWDESYQLVIRWKIEFTKLILPLLKKNKYGRLLFLESISVKQPVENLILSNSLRAAMAGFVKTLSQEVAAYGITANILAPGFHDTPAIRRLIIKKAEQTGMDEKNVLKQFAKDIPVGLMGNPDDLASLATWLLSPHSKYVTGQVIAHDGGLARGML